MSVLGLKDSPHPSIAPVKKKVLFFFRTCFVIFELDCKTTYYCKPKIYFARCGIWAVASALTWSVVWSSRPASHFRMEVLRRALHSSQTSSSMQQPSSDALETTLDKLTMAGCEEMRILFKSVYYDAYQLKTKDQSREFAKLVGKVTDKEGNGMYYEIRGKDKASCEKQFHTVLCGKPFFVSKLKVAKQNQLQFYAGLWADFAEKNSRTQFHAMATSHPSSMQMMHTFPTAKSDLGVLKRLGSSEKLSP